MYDINDLDNALGSNFAGENGAASLFMDFSGGAKDLNTEKQTDKRWSCKITNNYKKAVTVALHPGSFKTSRIMEFGWVDAADHSKGIYGRLANGGGDGTEAVMTAEELAFYGVTVTSLLGTSGRTYRLVNDSTQLMKASGILIDAVLEDGKILCDSVDQTQFIYANAINASQRIALFKQYVQDNPARVIEMHITPKNNDGSVATHFYEQAIMSQKTSPFVTSGVEYTYLQEFFDPTVAKISDKVIVRKPFQFDAETLVYLTIPAECNIQITFVIGATMNLAKGLRKVSEKKDGKK